MTIITKIAVSVSFFAAGFISGTEFMSVLYGHAVNYVNVAMIIANLMLGLSNLAPTKDQKPTTDETLA